ncbi:hypothetical protein BH11MYX4_BH11MYX4_53940 [soil metagenome]
MSAPADLSPDVDTNLPGIDAATNPVPTQPGRDASAPDEAPDGSTTPTQKVAEAGTDAAPPPPTVPKPAAGEVLITEVMYATTGPEPASEWIELHSVASAERSLAGLMLKDGSNRTHVIVGPLTIAANAWVVLARSKAGATTAKVPPAAIVYEYGAGLGDSAGILLANGSTGGISLLSGATVINAAPYGGWFTGSGGSVQLKVLDGTQSGAKASWCLSPTAWTTGSEKGSPGSVNNCP